VRRFATSPAFLLLAGCAAAPPGAIQPPYWLESPVHLSSILRIAQTAAFAGSRRLRICRRIENVSARPALIRKVEPEGNNYQELLVAFYDRSGTWIAPPRPSNFFYDPSHVPPPPPASADDISIYTVMAPGEYAENCGDYEIEPGLNVFQAVTYYSPTVSADLVPERLRAGNLLLTNEYRTFASQPCLVNIRARRIDCAMATRAAVAGSARSR
jgi:hypothetical protein